MRSLVELERGKATARIGKAMAILTRAGMSNWNCSVVPSFGSMPKRRSYVRTPTAMNMSATKTDDSSFVAFLGPLNSARDSHPRR